jgi:hypothetical protein
MSGLLALAVGAVLSASACGAAAAEKTAPAAPAATATSDKSATTTDTKATATSTAPAAAKNVHATLVKIDGKNLVVKVAATGTVPAKDLTVATDDKTTFLLDYADAKLADLKPRMTLTIKPAEGTATWISAHVKGLYGVVTKVDGKNVVINATRAKKEVTLTTDEKTQVFVGGKAAKLADLKPEMEVKVVPPTGTAAKISVVPPSADTTKFVDTFNVDKANFADAGKSTYFVLIPGCKMSYVNATDTLVITVTGDTKLVDGVKTRVVEERETKNGKLEEVSRNWLAIDKATGDVYYFGEEVDMVDPSGKIVGHEGSWESGKNGARYGMFLPGKPKVGQAYCQEVAPKVAMDRAQIMSITDEVKVKAGTYRNCLRTKESSGLESAITEKLYAPDVGLLKDAEFELSKVEMPAGAPAKE